MSLKAESFKLLDRRKLHDTEIEVENIFLRQMTMGLLTNTGALAAEKQNVMQLMSTSAGCC